MRPRLYERIESLIDTKITAHQIVAEAPFEARLDVMAARLTKLETHIEILVAQGKHQQEVNEELLRAARNGRGG
jgi:hypothetical protein